MRWRAPAGRGHVVLPTHVMAMEFREKKRVELAADQHGLSLPHKNTFKDFAEEYLRDAYTYKTKRTVNNFDRPAVMSFANQFGQMELGRITQAQVNEWKLGLLKSYKPVTVRMRLRGLRAAFNYARVPQNPVKGVKMPAVEPVGRVLSQAEAASLLEALYGRPRDAFIFVLVTGVRLGELLDLDWSDIRRTAAGNMEALVYGRKTRSERIVPLHPAAVKAMGRPGSGKVFDVSRTTLHKHLLRRWRSLGMGRVRWHDLRHTWATRFMEQTGDFFALQKFGGWKDLSSMGIYQHLTKDRSASILGIDHGLAQNAPKK